MRYGCVNCRAPIELVHLAFAESTTARPGDYVDLHYLCSCVEEGALVRARYPYSLLHLRRLFNGTPALPYHSPFNLAVMAENVKAIRQWAGDISKCHGADEFLFRCEQGGSGGMVF